MKWYCDACTKDASPGREPCSGCCGFRVPNDAPVPPSVFDAVLNLWFGGTMDDVANAALEAAGVDGSARVIAPGHLEESR